MIEVEESVAAAFAERTGLPKDDLETRLLAAMTVSAMNVAIMAWYRGNYDDLSTAVEQVFSRFTRIACDRDKSNDVYRERPVQLLQKKTPLRKKPQTT